MDAYPLLFVLAEAKKYNLYINYYAIKIEILYRMTQCQLNLKIP